MGENSQRIALFNITDIVDKNPGCRATINGLRQVLNGEITFQFPLGYGYHYFNKKSIFKNNGKNNYKKTFKKIQKDYNHNWLLQFVDIVIINAEGTIHSDSTGAKTLLSFVRLAKELNKKVYVVNGSYYNLSRYLLEILGSCDGLTVREIESQNYLTEKNVKSTLVPDCAFLNSFNTIDKDKQTLYTPGVLFSHGNISKEKSLNKIIAAHYQSIFQYDKNPTFLQIESSENEFSKVWKDLGGEVLDSTNIKISDLIKEISSYQIVISGRYHILLFALMANTKTIPLTSNSKKIIGLYKTFGKKDVKPQNVFNSEISYKEIVELNVNIEEVKTKIINSYKKLFEY